MSDSTEEKCDFGSILSEDCHKLSYRGQKAGIQDFKNLPHELQETLLWRSEVPKTTYESVSTICHHHEYIFTKKFHQGSKCCDTFKLHKTRSKGDRVISLDFAKKLKEKDIEVTPGWKFCVKCEVKAKSLTKSEPSTSVISESESTSESESVIKTVELEGLRGSVASSFEAIGVSPLKVHGLPAHSRVPSAKKKLKRVYEKMEHQVSSILGVEAVELQESAGTSSTSVYLDKANALDKLHTELKAKLEVANYREKVQILTLAPTNWPRTRVSEVFGVSEYLVRKAVALKSEKGIMSIPEKKKGKHLSNDVTDAVRSFYEDDEYSRVMPGRKDYVSIGKNIHVQKRLLLCNLKELYLSFKDKTKLTIGFSTFAALRPKWCISVAAPGTQNVCVCSYHQNAKLMTAVLPMNLTYKDLMDKVVCNTDNKMCMVHRCSNCPGKEKLREFIAEQFESLEEEITVSQWTGTDRANMITQILTISDYIDALSDQIDKLTSHSYIAKTQSRYLKNRKEYLEEDHCIAIVDFAENYAFVVQDAIQSFHWNNSQCTIHPVALYYLKDGKLQVDSLAYLSDVVDHDTTFVYTVQKKLTNYLKDELPHINTLEYFSDGCAAQYKNCKNFINLCHHEADFGLKAQWDFFATSHGKSPADGIGGVIKRTALRASLQRVVGDQIVCTKAVHEICCSHLLSIKTYLIEQDEIEQCRSFLQSRYNRSFLQSRYNIARTVPGTRAHHQFVPDSNTTIKLKHTSTDEAFSFIHTFGMPEGDIVKVSAMEYAACKYDEGWWIGLVLECSAEHSDHLISFMHPPGSSGAQTFFWPSKMDTCWVPSPHVLLKIQPPSTRTGRTYSLINDELKLIQSRFLTAI